MNSKIIPFSQHDVDRSDLQSVLKVLQGEWLSSGPTVLKFEEELKNYTKAKFCVAVNSGTMALHLVMMGLKISKGDEIVTSPITFAASANCAVYVQAAPRFVDIEDKTLHLDINKLTSLLKSPSQRKRIKAIVLVHFSGTAADIPEVNRLCHKYGIPVIEDAAHALGALYQQNLQWHKIGACKHSKAAVLSFHPVKNITTGEGGAVLTNDRELYERVLRFRHHGIVRRFSKPQRALTQYKNEEWFYDIPEIGYNGRMTDIQAALGISQLNKINRFIERRRAIHHKYIESLSKISQIRLPFEREGSRGAYHIFPIRIPSNQRNRLYRFLKERGILTQVHYVPVHLLTYYQRVWGYKPGDFPMAEEYFKECLSLPLHTKLTDTQQKYVINSIKEFFDQ